MTDRRLTLDVLVDPDVANVPAAALSELASFAASVEPALPRGDWTVTLRLTDDQRIAPNRHGNGANGMFLDGHAAHVPSKRMIDMRLWDDFDYRP